MTPDGLMSYVTVQSSAIEDGMITECFYRTNKHRLSSLVSCAKWDAVWSGEQNAKLMGSEHFLGSSV